MKAKRGQHITMQASVYNLIIIRREFKAIPGRSAQD